MAFGQKFPNGLTYQEWDRFCEEQERFRQPREEHRPSLLVKRKPFLSVNEAAFLPHLKSWFPDLDIHCQVQLMRLVEVDNRQVAADLIESFFEQATRVAREFRAPSTREVQAEHWRHYNLFNLLSCDFVLVTESGVPLCVIELDGEEHRYDALVHQEAIKQDRTPASARTEAGIRAIERVRGWNRDAIKDLILRTAGIPLLRVENATIHHDQGLAQVRRRIGEALDHALSRTASSAARR